MTTRPISEATWIGHAAGTGMPLLLLPAGRDAERPQRIRPGDPVRFGFFQPGVLQRATFEDDVSLDVDHEQRIGSSLAGDFKLWADDYGIAIAIFGFDDLDHLPLLGLCMSVKCDIVERVEDRQRLITRAHIRSVTLACYPGIPYSLGTWLGPNDRSSQRRMQSLNETARIVMRDAMKPGAVPTFTVAGKAMAG